LPLSCTTDAFIRPNWRLRKRFQEVVCSSRKCNLLPFAEEWQSIVIAGLQSLAQLLLCFVPIIGIRRFPLTLASRSRYSSLAVALNCRMGSSSLNADVKEFDRLHMVRGWKSWRCGAKYNSCARRAVWLHGYFPKRSNGCFTMALREKEPSQPNSCRRRKSIGRGRAESRFQRVAGRVATCL
jgi:hypothetical protein